MISQKNTGDKELGCYIVIYSGLLALYIQELNIIISSRRKNNIDEHKIKSIRKLLNKIVMEGIFRVCRVSYTNFSANRRRFMVKQSDIIELLDYQGYEITD